MKGFPIRLGPRTARLLTGTVAPLLAYALTGAGILAAGMAAWRFGADAGWAGEFAVRTGLWSRWQVWLAVAAAALWAAHRLLRACRGPAS